MRDYFNGNGLDWDQRFWYSMYAIVRYIIIVRRDWDFQIQYVIGEERD